MLLRSRACSPALVAFALLATACFDEPPPPSGGDETGDPTTTGDGDGDPATGDGDGDPTGDGDGDPTGDGDGDPTGDGDGDPTGDGDGDPDPLCGNGRLDPGELCDDSQNIGVEEGDCASDCSAVVVVRTLVLSDTHNGALSSLPGDGDLPERVDQLCPVGYKALFTFGGARTATLTPFVGDGQVDWALRPWTRYETESGVWLGTTDAAALLGVRDGGWIGLQNPISPDQLRVWTGMTPDYRTIADPDEVCEGFANAGLSAWAGDAGTTELVDGQNFLQESVQTCILARPVLCADQ